MIGGPGWSDECVTVPDDMVLVRRLGVFVESIHAVVYFAPEPQAAYAALGLKGYWRGYFASRSAPLGEATPELVTALFGGFAPAMVARALPEVWLIASPQQVRVARQAIREGVAAERRARVMSDEQLMAFVRRRFWVPKYLPYRRAAQTSG